MPAGAGGVPEVEARNPVGRGLVGADEGDIAGRPLPNIEDPEQLIARPADRPAPAGLAPIPPAWQPRRGWAGTYDAAWQAGGRPTCRSISTRASSTWRRRAGRAGLPCRRRRGGSHRLHGRRGPVLPPAAPGHRPRVGFRRPRDRRGPRLDTVLIEPDQGRLQMVWRAELAVDKRLTRLRQVAVRWEPEGEHP
jgi:hypothetical protein